MTVYAIAETTPAGYRCTRVTCPTPESVLHAIASLSDAKRSSLHVNLEYMDEDSARALWPSLPR